jgi:translation initiation factor 1
LSAIQPTSGIDFSSRQPRLRLEQQYTSPLARCPLIRAADPTAATYPCPRSASSETTDRHMRRLAPGRERIVLHMADRNNARIVYSTDKGRICPRCGWPGDQCRCSRKSQDEALPPRIVAKLRVEKAGRSGKTVTVVFGLPQNAVFLKELCQELKRGCGTGGAVVDATVELQGDLRERVRGVLMARGITVKG